MRHEMFADDTQLTHSESPSSYDSMVQSLEDCVLHIKSWMSQNRLKLNDDKTEALQLLPPCVKPETVPSSFVFSQTCSFSDHVRDLGFVIDRKLSMEQHVTKCCQLAYLELRRISSIRNYLSVDATKTLVTSCVLSRLDYCNALLAGSPLKLLKPLQQVQNSAARLIFKSKKFQHCSSLFIDLHWLPIDRRIQFKTSCICYNIITGTAPNYLSELFQIYVPSRSLRSAADNRLFVVPRFNRTKHGGRAFSSNAVLTWNSLPFSVRHCPTFSSFKTALKTFLFQQAYT